MKIKEHIKRYSELDVLAKKIKQEMEQLKSKIYSEMKEEDYMIAETEEYGSMSIYPRRKWLYPQEIQDKEDELNKMKEVAEQVGTAMHSDSEHIRYYPIRE